jgi:hypothetical protein
VGKLVIRKYVGNMSENMSENVRKYVGKYVGKYQEICQKICWKICWKICCGKIICHGKATCPSLPSTAGPRTMESAGWHDRGNEYD